MAANVSPDSSSDPSSVLWMYHSHVNEARDVNAGLVGPIIVTRHGMVRADGSPTDVDREFVVAFAETNENVSWYIDDNIKSFVGHPAGTATWWSLSTCARMC